ncbi:PAS domain-containing protein [Aridibaculum aurantiacum]|uniref:PAS domain-containing protein n=1 Tax=Aridibaculum aurantiacum TaxID=2810307 RepID=UPI001A977669|nr:PAS domain-containing protein [Aridibaculum aurantiacum]
MLNTFTIDIVPGNDEQRLDALYRYKILDAPSEESFNNLTQIIADVFDVPIALISLVDKERVVFKGNVGMPGVKNVDRGLSLCSLAVLSDGPTIINNTLEDPCLLMNPLVHGDFGLRFYAGAPLVTPDGFNIGTVCIVDKKPRNFTDREQERLQRFASTVMHEIELRLGARQQAEAEQEVRQKNIELNDLNKELRFLMDTIPQLTWSTNAEGEIDFVNNGWMDYTGLRFEDLLGNGWLQTIHPLDQQEVNKIWKSAVASGSNYEVQYRLRKSDGSYRWFLARGNAMKDSNGKILKWYGTTTDIHDQKNAEEVLEKRVQERTAEIELQKTLLNNILTNSPSGIVVYMPVRNNTGEVTDFTCVLANQAAEQFTEIPNEWRMTKTLLQIAPQLKESPLFQMAVTALEQGKDFQAEYYNEPIKKWFSLSVVKMDDDHLINVFSDITSRKETQLQLEHTVEELKRSNDELEQFAYVASHDLQEPLRKIRFFNNMISEKVVLQNDAVRYISKVEESASRMSALIINLLEYSRLNQSGKQFEKVDLTTVVKRVVSDYELLIQQKQAKVSIATLDVVEANPLQMNQLFFNIIGNSLKFSNDDIPPVVEITSCKLPEEQKQHFPHLKQKKDYHCITIRDNGIGFQQEYANKIFSIFQRLNERSMYGGYGIGMAICKKIIDVHQGAIYAEGEPMKGAAFTIILPYEQE